MLNNDIPSISSGQEPFLPGKLRDSYAHFYGLCREMKFNLEFASPYDYHWDSGTIRGFWQWTGTRFEPVPEPFRPNFIFDKAMGADPHCNAVIAHCDAQGIPIYGPVSLAQLCGDKWRVYQQFQRFSPLTELLSRDKEEMVGQLHAFFRKMDAQYADHDNRAIVKPLHGFQSRGIHLISRTPAGLEMRMLFGGQIHGIDLERNLESMCRTPYLIQAWVNTGAGIPGVGLAGQFHDVRFIFRIRNRGDAEFVLLYVKTLEGMHYVPLDFFRESDPFQVVTPVADWIADHWSYGIFSVDVMRDVSGQWFLTELNDQVGLTIDFDQPDEVDEMTRFMRIYIAEMSRIFNSENN